MMLRQGDESGHIYLVPDMSIGIQSFTIKYDFSCRFSIDALYQLEEITCNSWFT